MFNSKLLVAAMLACAFIASATVGAIAGAGYWYGWTVELNGTEVCDDPYVNTSTRTIECD